MTQFLHHLSSFFYSVFCFHFLVLKTNTEAEATQVCVTRLQTYVSRPQVNSVPDAIERVDQACKGEAKLEALRVRNVTEGSDTSFQENAGGDEFA